MLGTCLVNLFGLMLRVLQWLFLHFIVCFRLCGLPRLSGLLTLLRLVSNGFHLLLRLRFRRLVIAAANNERCGNHCEPDEEDGDSTHGSQPICTSPPDHSDDC